MLFLYGHFNFGVSVLGPKCSIADSSSRYTMRSSSRPSPRPGPSATSSGHPQPRSTHRLRSGTEYDAAEEWSYRNPRFEQIFAKACEFFKNNGLIPHDILTKLDTFTLSEREYYDTIAVREDRLRHVYWEDGKIKFNTFTQPPHGTATGMIQQLIGNQLPADRIFVSCNDCIYL